MSRVFIVLPVLAIVVFTYCNNQAESSPRSAVVLADSPRIVSDIAPPPGYTRKNMSKNPFGEWLRTISLKKDNHVRLYNGDLKRNQQAQFAVLDISIGNKDLQQCADALMRLRAEFLFSKKRFSEIEFTDNAGKSYRWTGGSDRRRFDKYLETVFSMCGSASLEKQLTPVALLQDIQPGDVLIKGGFPGHAMIVIDVAANEKGDKIFMLAQSYMPAQDIHIVRNPSDENISPWYEVNDEKYIVTPEWTFLRSQLRRW